MPALAAPRATMAALQAIRVLTLPGRSPLSMAWEMNSGGIIKPTIHSVPQRPPRAHRSGCDFTSHHRYASGLPVSGVPGSGRPVVSMIVTA